MKNSLLVKNLFCITEYSTHYDLILPSCTKRLYKPLDIFLNIHGYYVCHSDRGMDTNLFIDSSVKNYIDCINYRNYIDIHLNYKIVKALLTFLKYEEQNTIVG